MTRLLVHVEGQTEESFVNEILAPHLYGFGFHSVQARLLGHSARRIKRGGIKPWPSVRDDIVRHMTHDPGCFATLMVDYYALPATGEKAWPGRSAAASLAASAKGEAVEQAICDQICQHFAVPAHECRFIPFVLMHEFEALLFSDCAAFSAALGMPHLAAGLQAVRGEFNTPEEINDSPQTAPSKRLSAMIPGYEKPIFGLLAASEIGLERMRLDCPNFDVWLSRLERLGPARS